MGTLHNEPIQIEGLKLFLTGEEIRDRLSNSISILQVIIDKQAKGVISIAAIDREARGAIVEKARLSFIRDHVIPSHKYLLPYGDIVSLGPQFVLDPIEEKKGKK